MFAKILNNLNIRRRWPMIDGGWLENIELVAKFVTNSGMPNGHRSSIIGHPLSPAIGQRSSAIDKLAQPAFPYLCLPVNLARYQRIAPNLNRCRIRALNNQSIP